MTNIHTLPVIWFRSLMVFYDERNTLKKVSQHVKPTADAFISLRSIQTVLKFQSCWARKETDCLFVCSDGGNFPLGLRSAFISVCLSLFPRWTLSLNVAVEAVSQSVSCSASEALASHLSICWHHLSCCLSRLIPALIQFDPCWEKTALIVVAQTAYIQYIRFSIWRADWLCVTVLWSVYRQDQFPSLMRPDCVFLLCF